MSDSAPNGSGDPDAAFAAVSDPTRVAILRALAAHTRETGETTAGFAVLRKRAGVEDPGRFRYHLNTLVGRFVERTEDGYRLSHAGSEIVAAILAGRYTDHKRLGPTTVDGACNVCGAAATGIYEDGRLDVTCENDHPLLRWSIPPNAAADATVSELATLATSLIRHAIDLSLQGVCVECYGTMTTRIEAVPTEADDGSGADGGDEGEAGDGADGRTSRPTPRFRADCETCTASLVGPAWFALTVHPTVDAFYHDHGRPIRDSLLWELGHVEYETTRADDGAVVVTVGLDDERLHVTLSDAGEVVETAIESA
jgi:DNA-binding transcriptional ArsR family regulator